LFFRLNFIEKSNLFKGQSKLFQKMLEQVKKDQNNEIEKIHIKYAIPKEDKEISKENLESPKENKENLEKNNKNTEESNKNVEEIKKNIDKIVEESNKNVEESSNKNIKTEGEAVIEPKAIEVVKEEEEKKDSSNDARIKKLEKEKEEKIKSVLAKFGNQISQLETQLKQNKGNFNFYFI